MTRQNIHKYVGPSGFNRIKHTRAMIEERIALTEKYGEHSGNSSLANGPRVSSFTIETNDNPRAVEALRTEVAQYIGDTTAKASNIRVIVPYDGTEDIKIVESTQPERTPTSRFRASLPA